MVFDYRISRVDFPVGGYAECLQLLMPDNQRVGVMFSRSNNGATEIGTRPFDTLGFGFTTFDVLTPLILLYKDFGDLVKSEFWGVVQTTNGIVQIVEIIKIN